MTTEPKPNVQIHIHKDQPVVDADCPNETVNYYDKVVVMVQTDQIFCPIVTNTFWTTDCGTLSDAVSFGVRWAEEVLEGLADRAAAVAANKTK